jgi:hypothetical protein
MSINLCAFFFGTALSSTWLWVDTVLSKKGRFEPWQRFTLILFASFFWSLFAQELINWVSRG